MPELTRSELSRFYPKYNEAFPNRENLIPMIGCLTGNIPGDDNYKGKPEDVAECFEALAYSDRLRALRLNIIQPWRAAVNTAKGPVQMVKGIDKKRYLVVKMGDRYMGFCMMRLAATGVAVGTISALAWGWGLYWFFTATKRGKKIWRNIRR